MLANVQLNVACALLALPVITIVILGFINLFNRKDDKLYEPPCKWNERCSGCDFCDQDDGEL